MSGDGSLGRHLSQLVLKGAPTLKLQQYATSRPPSVKRPTVPIPDKVVPMILYHVHTVVYVRMVRVVYSPPARLACSLD